MNPLNRLLATTFAVGCALVCSPAAAAEAPGNGLSREAAAGAKQHTGQVEGLVIDERGRPLAGAAVTMQGRGFVYVVSDAAGRFVFEQLEPGPYVIRAQMPGFLASERTLIQVLPDSPAWHRLHLTRRGDLAESAAGTAVPRAVMTAGFAPPADVADDEAEGTDSHDDGATAWRLRHAKRSILREATAADLGDTDDVDTIADAGQARLAAELWSGLPVSGQVQFLSTSSFDSPEDLLSTAAPRGVAYVEVSAPAGRSATWSVQGALTQGDVSSWVLGGTYVGKVTEGHSLDAGLSYATQRYVGGNPLALAAVNEGTRTVGAMFAFDEWAIGPETSLTYGASYARYGYLESEGLLSPSVTLKWAVGDRVWLRATAERRVLAPGAEEFVPSPVAGLWLPPQRTFSPLSPEAGFRAERTRHFEMVFERELGTFLISARGFREDVDDQVVTLFGLRVPDAPRTDLGHYYTANAGGLAAFGWGFEVRRPVASRLRGSVAYTVTHGDWRDGAQETPLLAIWAPSSTRLDGERLHDVTTVVETDIPETATRVYAAYRINTGFASPSIEEDDPVVNARFDVQVAQRLPFLEFTNAKWEVLLAIRNLFRDLDTGSFYDELLVVRPPKRIVGGLLVRF